MSQGGGASPAPAAQDNEAVLGEVLVQQRAMRQGPAQEEDPDLALAKMLQAQEQAWLAMAGAGSGILENLPPAGGGASPGGTAQPAAGAGGEGEALTDEEVARLLQEQEEREFQSRLLALAGVGPAGPAGGAGGAGEAGAPAAGDAVEEYATEDEVDPDEMTYEELTALGEVVGTVSKGLSAEAVEALPLAEYAEAAGAAAAAAGADEEQCPICRVEYAQSDVVRVLPLCGHYAHPECMGEWLKRNKVCVLCNKEVVEEGKQSGSASACAAPAGSVLGERRRQ